MVNQSENIIVRVVVRGLEALKAVNREFKELLKSAGEVTRLWGIMGKKESPWVKTSKAPDLNSFANYLDSIIKEAESSPGGSTGLSVNLCKLAKDLAEKRAREIKESLGNLDADLGGTRKASRRDLTDQAENINLFELLKEGMEKRNREIQKALLNLNPDFWDTGGASRGEAPKDSFLPDADALKEFGETMREITEKGTAQALKAAITDGNVGAVIKDTLTDLATQAFMSAAGNRLVDALVGGGIPFIPFFQEGGYTGEREGLAYLHKREYVIPEGLIKGRDDAGLTETPFPAAPPAGPSEPGRTYLAPGELEKIVRAVAEKFAAHITVELKGKAGNMFDIFISKANDRGARLRRHLNTR